MAPLTLRICSFFFPVTQCSKESVENVVKILKISRYIMIFLNYCDILKKLTSFGWYNTIRYIDIESDMSSLPTIDMRMCLSADADPQDFVQMQTDKDLVLW